VTSDSRNHITPAELVLLDLASLAYDHSVGRGLRLKEVVIEIGTLVQGNIHFDQAVDVVYYMPYEVAMGELVQMVILNLLHLSISLLIVRDSGEERKRTYLLNPSRWNHHRLILRPYPLLPGWSIEPGDVLVILSTWHDPDQSPLLV
jgi:hypothetical protein